MGGSVDGVGGIKTIFYLNKCTQKICFSDQWTQKSPDCILNTDVSKFY